MYYVFHFMQLNISNLKNESEWPHLRHYFQKLCLLIT
jgi:hypothetical protein